jgi:hypothetical protein
MRKPIIWATSLAAALLGAVLISCDSKGSAPTSSGNDTTGTGSVTHILTVSSPLALDTTVPNSTQRLWILGKVTPAQAGLAIVGGDTTVITQSNGGFVASISNLSLGQKTVKLKLASDTNQSVSVNITRRLGAPLLVPMGALSTTTSFQDSARIQLTSPNNYGDSIWFTTNGINYGITGTDPRVASGFVKTIKGTTTIKAIAFKSTASGLLTSDTTLVTYTINFQAATPSFSVSRVDSSNIPVKIAILASGAGDTIRYTTTGGDPTNTSTIYKDSILVSDSTTIIAKAFNGPIPSPACTTTVKMIASTPTFSIKGGNYTSQKNLVVTSPSGLPVYFTTDGSTPTPLSPHCNNGDTLLLDSNLTLKAYAYRPRWRPSGIDSAAFHFKVATPVLSSSTGNYDTTQLLSLTDSATGAVIHYTVDGSTPTCSSPVYNPASLLRLDSTVTIQARACLVGWDSSNIATGNDTFKVAKITFSPDSGVYRSYQTVKLSTRSPGVSLFVTRDSTQPSWDVSGNPTGSTQKLHSGDTLQLTQSQWLRVVAQRSGWASSAPDSRRYVIQGDTLMVDDFEQNSLSNPIGTNWRFWACGYCTGTGITNLMSGIADTTAADWSHQLGFRFGKIDFTIPDYGSLPVSDDYNGPGYAGYSVGVPDSLMGETYRIVFWAKWVKGSASLPDSMPMASEMVWNNNDNQGGAYHDGFDRYVDWVGPTWRRYVIDFASYRPAANAYEKTLFTDSTNSTPKSFWLVDYPDSARMVSMGLSKFQGWVDHSGLWTPHWRWGADHDNWSKNTIHAFRWSILQPSTDNSADPKDSTSIARLTRGLNLPALKDTIVDSTYTDTTGGSHQVTVQVTHQVPTTIYCGDCHYPEEPVYSDYIRSKFLKGIKGSLELDRIQLVRRPQPGK